ncbi:MAG TPA: MarR family transcriptional regulator [Candidatus Nanopelagicales bacterium]|nr:MarR family transcriptional regulator [Candidatus Nanopelagicales bacterium]
MPSNASDLRIAVMRLARRLRTERASDTLTPSQLAVLATLMREGPMCPGDLAGAERVQPPSMTRILNSLQAAGMVTKTRHPEDGRQVLYAATGDGEQLVTRDRERRDNWLSHRLQELTEDERATLQAAMPILNRLALG